MPDYAELHAHSYYSLLDAASSPEALVARAANLGLAALALTDHDALYGVVPFLAAASEHGLHAVVGAEITLAGGHHLTLLVENATGWRHLCHLITVARHHATKGNAALPPSELEGHTEGLIALSGCRKGEVADALLRGDGKAALAAAQRYRALFGPDRFFIELQRHLLPEEDALVHDLVALARHLGLGYVATNNVHYARREDHRLQDVLVAIRHNRSLDEARPFLRPNSEFYLKGPQEMAALFADYPEALAATVRVAARCRFDLRYDLQDLPLFPTPDGMDALAYLRSLCEQALPGKYSTRPRRARAQLARELAVIARAGLANYVLIVWDIVRFCRERGILCQGRGSAANSLVAYLLDITPIDPLAHDLVFERFLTAERPLPPDIDLDIQADRREEVIQYVMRRYGPEHAAMAAAFVTFRQRSARRDAAKALGLEVHGSPEEDPPLLQEMTAALAGLPRHLGIHNGGMVITGPPLAHYVPTEPAAMPGRVVVQWDKDMLEEVGLVKIDLLGLRMLAAMAEALDLIEERTGARPDLERLPFDDPEVYALIARGDTVGVFQVESRAQAQILPRLKPRTFHDLIVAISLVRPGPLQGNMVHPYLRRRQGREPITYPHPRLKEALAETLGVILFQEQVLKVARDLAGFTPGQGEVLRRALGKKDAAAAIARLRDAFLRGAEQRGVPRPVAEEVFAQVQAFGGYAFPKSHATAFAVLVYRSAWLKRHYPAAFYCALLNQQPMGFWSPAVLVGDARRHGVRVLPVDIERSGERCTLEGKAIRLGLNYVKGLGEAGVARILSARRERPFADLADFCRRTGLPRDVVERLILAGAMDAWRVPRRQLLWQLGTLRYREEALPLPPVVARVDLPPVSRAEAVAVAYGLLGLPTGEHLLALYREALAREGVLTAAEVREAKPGARVRVAGLVAVYQAPPTARGVRFLTLEDETGLVDVVVRPEVHARYRRILEEAAVLIVTGVVQRREGTVSVLAETLHPIP